MAFFRKKKEIPVGLWMKCPACGKMAFTKTVEENFHVCPECDHHMKCNGPLRVKHLLDEGSFESVGEELEPRDILRFRDEHDYEDKLRQTQAKSGVSEACTAGHGTLDGREIAIAFLDFSFRGGSMGVVVGERVACAAEIAYERRIPLLILSTSGGARMQEGALSLMQMAKTSATIARLRQVGVPFISLLADPCTGGVSASFAAQGDITIAEPNALIGFAGPRVIQNTIKTQLPEGFQRAEFLLEKGYIDRIVHRRDLKRELARLLDYLRPRPRLAVAPNGVDPNTATPKPAAAALDEAEADVAEGEADA